MSCPIIFTASRRRRRAGGGSGGREREREREKKKEEREDFRADPPRTAGTSEKERPSFPPPEG